MVEVDMRHMNITQRAEIVTCIVNATNALYPERDASLVASAMLGSAPEGSVTRVWIVDSPNPETTLREIRRIQAESWLYAEVVKNGTVLMGSVSGSAPVVSSV